MKRTSTSLVVGLILGAVSWAIVPIMSGRFEPFDSEIGFYTGQIMLATAAFYLGFTHGMKQVLVYIVGVYIGSIIYAYVFGSSDARALIIFGLIVTWGLCIFPLLSGIIGKLVRIGKIKYNKHL